MRQAPRSLWEVPARLAALDAAGIQHQVISPLPLTLIDWAEPALATEWARTQNELISEAVRAAGGQLSGLGGLPFCTESGEGLLLEAALAELARVSADPHLTGVELPTLVAGREFDDPALRPLWSAAERLHMPIFVHPADSRGSIRRRGQPYEFGIGMLTDTAMAATALIYGGVLEQFPGLRIALAHGCGAMVWMFPRVRLMGAALGAPPERADDLLRRLWVDALVFEPEHLRLLARRFGAEHIMLGTDDPLVPGQLSAAPQAVFDAVTLGALAAEDADGVLGGNALSFFT